MQKFPELKNNQVALLRADTRTGIVVDEMLSPVINDEQIVYTILDSYYEALKIAESIIENEDNVDCLIYGKNQDVLFTLSTVIRKLFAGGFHHHLEFHLEQTFAKSPDHEISGFWCDGVAMPHHENHLTIKRLVEKKKITTMAWIGPDGQRPYEMTLKLGEKSIGNLLKGLSLIDCLPDVGSIDWISLDVDSGTIELQLN